MNLVRVSLFVCSRRARLVYAFRESAFGFVCLFTRFVIMNTVREHIYIYAYPLFAHKPSSLYCNFAL